MSTRHTANTSRKTPAPARDDDARWQAVQAKDPGCDGQFVFAVRSTGIYCRPSCPARRPLRENVSFHPTPEAARAAGFRACKRCCPDDVSPSKRLIELMAEACRTIERESEPPRLAAQARAAGFSPFHFQRTFKAIVGLTPRDYAAQVRAARLRSSLVDARTVTQAIHEAGFSSNSRFYAAQRSILGMPARSYRKGGEGLSIRYATAVCWLGIVLVAASDHGVCTILLGDGAATLEQDLARRFPRATLVPADRAFAETIKAVVAHIEAPASGLQLPLDLRGSAFQHRVWQALTRIPPGQTRSYGALASELGVPGAARAVARACAQNPLAVVVPCHRVIGTDGAITGYRWGVERKRALLMREGAAPTGKPKTA